ncbi:hypothetical protein [Curtobacterium sp. VKM Ac-1376]|uniref:hypothetical protein n=1 Tax=Curtobacterium sp. VKM Ac-1376 TaxID=123312 RepID=UPI00188BDD78|nr:hypothetical protein [Curtobacterium sp. VKM Ac-1376]MBF4616410.1 hypothetical protein [Curtobacterium sp. VKM Ac-1376]
MPGMTLATSDGIDINVNATLTDETVLSSTVTVPTVEAAVILKSYAWRDRPGAGKDATDLYNLFLVLDQHGSAAVGGWRLDQSNLTGARGDAARNLHQLADRLDTRPNRRGDALDNGALALLIREHITEPE